MKSSLFKLSLSLLLVNVAGFSFCQTDVVVKFENQTLKFGKVNEGEKISLTYHFRNLGKHTLSIVPPEVDCSCTEVIIPENGISGGARDSIIIHFDTQDKIGYQERKVVVNFTSDFMDSAAAHTDELIFKGVVNASEETKARYKAMKKLKNETKD